MPTNPFSKYLSQWSTDADFEAFRSYWDDLELVVVGVYRRKMTIDDAAAEFERVWPWLRTNYPRWQPALEPYWRQTRAAGAPTAKDPFMVFLDKGRPADILGDWNAMQHLPAARETINRYLLDHAPGNE